MSKAKTKTENDKSERIAFVISPIGDPDTAERKRANQILKHILEPAASECGYKTVRSDHISKPGIITSQIIEHLLKDPLVIADLTGHNPNVFYELAIRHAIKKPTIQLIRKGEKIPFDVSTQRTIQVDHQDLDSVAEAKAELAKQIKAVEKDPSLVDSPVSATVDIDVLKQSRDPEVKAIAELRRGLQEINVGMMEILDKLESIESEGGYVTPFTSTQWIPTSNVDANVPRGWVQSILDKLTEQAAQAGRESAKETPPSKKRKPKGKE